MSLYGKGNSNFVLFSVCVVNENGDSSIPIIVNFFFCRLVYVDDMSVQTFCTSDPVGIINAKILTTSREDCVYKWFRLFVF